MKKLIARTLTFLLLALNLVALSATAHAQGAIELRGTVIDETRAFIPAAPVVLDDGKGQKYTTQTDEQGRYRFTAVQPGVYTITVEVEGFAPFSEQIDLTARRTAPFDITLAVFIKDEIQVKDDQAAISSEPDKNLSAITLTDKDLEALPDDPDELLDTLKQMAGAAGGADETAIYVGGFRERGRIPPKEAIQMVRINANPFAAEFQEPGFARVEIITKPGSDTFHGGFRLNFNDESLNARNAFATFKAPLQTRSYGANFSGPLIRNRWGFFMNFDRREQDENEVINATTLAPDTLEAVPFITTLLVPTRVSNFEIRTDYLATKKHTIGAGYRFMENKGENLGIGGFDLPERAINRSIHEDNLRFSLTTIVSERAVNEARLQLTRRTFTTQALSDAPTIQVLDAFTSGGNQGSLFRDDKNDSLEFTDSVTYSYKTHTLKFGVRADAFSIENINRSNFGGTYTFASLEQYRNTLLGLPLARPAQFSINRGDPFVGFSQWEMGWFMQDDWRVSPQLTLSYGLRHEFQTNLQDKMNFAPRVGMAWSNKKRTSTLRFGGGVFYNRLDSGITFDALRLDGLHQQQFIFLAPGFFPNIPDTSGTIAQQPTIRVKAEDLNAPYAIIATTNYERQLPWKILGSVGYTWNRGVHLLRTRNINAPIAVDGNGPVLPDPNSGPILQFESTGTSNRHELRLGARTNISRTFTMFGNYTLARVRSDSDSAYTTPADPFDLSTEYGRASQDIRHQFFFGGSILTRWNLRISPFIRANSGRPFNITTGRDLNGDTSFSDRPSFATPGEPGAVVTAFGVFDPTPEPGDEIIPRNFGQGPSFVSVNLSVAKTFGFGPPQGGNFPAQATNRQQSSGQGQQAQNQQGQGQRGNNQRGNNQNRGQGRGGQGGPAGGQMVTRGPGGPGGGGFGGGGFFSGDSRNKYNLTLQLNFNNLLNHPNLGNYNGTLTSPFFGLANRTAGFDGSRRIEASLRFSF
ncbi:MAG TPA: carboxypeptidase regulatory-like domain-containing protein [Blastocatellia bacterium]|nr:carboxypeptidase regulatory-like domain-containing protein [Blastocatellia bacterium]